MRLSPNLAPEKIVSASAVVAAIILSAALWLSTEIPSLGLRLSAQDNAVLVGGIRAGTAPPKLKAGQAVLGIFDDQGESISLAPVDLTPEPDMVFKRYSDMDAFFARQSERRTLMSQKSIQIETKTGTVRLTPAPTRPLLSLPFVFWFQLFCGISGLLAGASIWAYRRQDPATKYYALTGIGLMCSACTAAIYSTRELAINGPLFKALSAINEFGALLFCGGLIAVLWYYPTRLARFAAGPWIIALYVAFGLAIPLRLHDSVEILGHFPIMVGYFSTYVLAAAQWRKTRGDPLQRAALRWFLFSWLFGSGAFLAFVYIPAFLGYDSGAIQGYAFGFFVLIYIGVAVGVLRYKLFRLDRWWFIAWVIFLGGLAVIALDLLFIYALQMNTRASLLVSMATAGWLYFPLRQWLMSRVLSSNKRAQSPVLVRMVTNVLARPEDEPNDAWRSLLQQVFAPNSLASVRQETADAVAENGLALNVAGSAGVQPQQLHYCQGGARLFHPQDIEMLADLRALFVEMLRYRERLHQAVADERDRVARDLHDDVGARLLTLVHSADGTGAEQARQALAELRAVVYSMRAPPIQIADLLGDWRAEAAERFDAAGVPMCWQVDGEPPTIALGGGPALALSRVMRETLSNALRHGGGAVELSLKFAGTRLFSEVANQYAGGDPAKWHQSLGLHNVRDRLDRIGGEVAWVECGDRLICRWSVDLMTASARDERANNHDHPTASTLYA